jgi:hypothetical protein
MMNVHTRAHTRVDIDSVLRDLTVVGFIGLVAWTMVGAFGTLMGLLLVQPEATLRFLLAVSVLVFARHVYWDLLEWRRHKLPPEERYGFSSPVRERPRAEELPHEVEVEITPSSSQAER